MPPEGLTIRPAHEGDASRIASLHVRSKRSVYPAFMPAAYVATLDQDSHRVDHWQPYFASGGPEREAWIAFMRGIPAGFVALDRPPTEDAAPADHRFLHHMHVAPEFRGRGVGAALLEVAVRHASEGGARGMALWTQRDNEGARAFYERAGWRADGATAEVEYQWSGGAFTVPDVRYVRALP